MHTFYLQYAEWSLCQHTWNSLLLLLLLSLRYLENRENIDALNSIRMLYAIINIEWITKMVLVFIINSLISLFLDSIFILVFFFNRWEIHSMWAIFLCKKCFIDITQTKAVTKPWVKKGTNSFAAITLFSLIKRRRCVNNTQTYEYSTQEQVTNINL